MTETIELYCFPRSTASQKVRLCQFEKGLTLTERLIDLTQFEQLDPGYLALNPRGQVPTLVVNGRPITEASIINEYLDERFPDPPLLPRDPLLKARVRIWTKYIDEVPTVKIASPTYRAWVAPAMAGRPLAPLLELIDRAPDETTRARWERTLRGGISDEEIEDAYRTLEEMLARMEALLAKGPWLFGDSCTLADLETLPIVMRLDHLGRSDLVAQAPGVLDWVARMKVRPSFAATYAYLSPAA